MLLGYELEGLIWLDPVTYRRYLDVMSSYQRLPVLPVDSPGFYIIYTGHPNGPGEHWTCLYISTETAAALTGTASAFGHPRGCIPAWLACIPCYTTACSIRDLSVYCVVYMPCSMHVDEAEVIQLWRICLNTTSTAATIRSALIFASPSAAHYEWRC